MFFPLRSHYRFWLHEITGLQRTNYRNSILCVNSVLNILENKSLLGGLYRPMFLLHSCMKIITWTNLFCFLTWSKFYGLKYVFVRLCLFFIYYYI